MTTFATPILSTLSAIAYGRDYSYYDASTNTIQEKHLNFFEMFLRYVFGFYEETHLATVLKQAYQVTLTQESDEKSLNSAFNTIRKANEVYQRQSWFSAVFYGAMPISEKAYFPLNEDVSILYRMDSKTVDGGNEIQEIELRVESGVRNHDHGYYPTFHKTTLVKGKEGEGPAALYVENPFPKLFEVTDDVFDLRREFESSDVSHYSEQRWVRSVNAVFELIGQQSGEEVKTMMCCVQRKRSQDRQCFVLTSLGWQFNEAKPIRDQIDLSRYHLGSYVTSSLQDEFYLGHVLKILQERFIQPELESSGHTQISLRRS